MNRITSFIARLIAQRLHLKAGYWLEEARGAYINYPLKGSLGHAEGDLFTEWAEILLSLAEYLMTCEDETIKIG